MKDYYMFLFLCYKLEGSWVCITQLLLLWTSEGPINVDIFYHILV